MRVSYRCAALSVPLSLSLIGCSAEGEPAVSVESAVSASPEAEKTEPAKPVTAEDFLDRAQEAMAAEGGWTFGVKGSESLVLQGQTSTASYEAALRRTQDPDALHSSGTVVSKGKRKPEEIFVIDGTAYVKEGGDAWKHGPVSDPDMKNKVEDPMAAMGEFRKYVRESGDDVTLTKAGGRIRLQVRSGPRKLPEVRDRAFVEKAVREFGPTLKQLQKAGVSATEDQLTLSQLEETLILDPETYRVESHRFRFGFLIPYGGQDITFGQDVNEENRGVFEGDIELPADANA
ncbi:hypothetical protein HRW18_13095 [Streptomyces lunaelactis]|nr:hypothetical protein [Streptomyces lunaelactis]NUL10899.1 hypothetical protein [Streptomyces lunaelactis]NUL23578.1 hypothetical protein [Streptomyces lunaelactis]